MQSDEVEFLNSGSIIETSSTKKKALTEFNKRARESNVIDFNQSSQALGNAEEKYSAYFKKEIKMEHPINARIPQGS